VTLLGMLAIAVERRSTRSPCRSPAVRAAAFAGRDLPSDSLSTWVCSSS